MQVTFKHYPLEDLKKACEVALFGLREQAVTDCNFFARQYTGDLKASAHAETKDDELVITYDVPYAARVYDKGTPSRDRNPNASLRWCEVAERTFGKSWIKIIEKGLTEVL